jgi:hypothetical protein
MTRFLRRLHRPHLFVIMMAVVGLGIGVLSGGLLSRSTASEPIDMDMSLTLSTPKSIDDLVQVADVIVVGKVGPIVNQANFSGYGKDDAQRNQRPGDPVSPSLPVTDYQIEVQDVLLDDGLISSGEPLILRAFHQPKNEVEAYTGDHNLLFLSRNPDNATYGLYYISKSRIAIDGPVATYSDGTAIPFADRLSPATFIKNVQDSVSRVKPVEQK